MTVTTTPVLQVDNLALSFGSLRALDGISLAVHPGEVVGLIGPNGAGKSSLLNCMSGLYHPHQGRIWLQGRDITRLPPHKRAQLGLGRSFQGIQVYPGMSVLQNIMSGAHVHLRTGVLAALIHWPLVHREELLAREAAEEIIEFLDLAPYRHKPVGELGYGVRKRVDLGRALALRPKILLMDEPMAGMNVEEKEDMARFILDVNEQRRVPVVLVEHDMEVVMDICDRIVVLDWGRLIAAGPPDQVRQDPAVISAYLGVS